jgi:hypothetical protein
MSTYFRDLARLNGRGFPFQVLPEGISTKAPSKSNAAAVNRFMFITSRVRIPKIVKSVEIAIKLLGRESREITFL